MAFQTFTRICPFCESSCGLKVEADVETGQLGRIVGDPDHPGSRGYLCPKSQGLRAVREDPERVTKPLVREGSTFREASWEEALDRAAAGLKGVMERHGPSSVAKWGGNPAAHVSGIYLGAGVLTGLMPGYRSGASSVDVYPRFFVDMMMYGNAGSVPVPDLERTDYFIIFGGNPLASNGSMMGAPNMPLRLRRLRERGGKLVVVDPRRTETARVADEHLPVRPGGDALLAMAMVHTLFEENLVRLGHLEGHVTGLDVVREVVAEFSPERVAPMARIDADTIRRVTREFAAAPRAVAYGRVGANCQTFGTLAIWMIDMLNLLTAHFDRIGCATFPLGVLPQGVSAGYDGETPPYDRWRSRVSKTPEMMGQVPSHVLWEEMEVPGEGQVKGLLVHAGNPAVSNANAGRVVRALENLEFIVCIDIYVNETTRFADVILPPMEHLKRTEFTTIYGDWTLESIAAYSSPIFPRQPDDHDDWDIAMELAARLSGRPLEEVAQSHAEAFLGSYMDRMPRLHGMSAAEALARADGDTLSDKMYDVLLRGGPFGDGFGAYPGGLNLQELQAAGAGVNLGSIPENRFPEKIQTPDRKVRLAPAQVVEDVARLRASIDAGDFDSTGFLLINRRHLRSNNSWFHNLPALVKGRDRCTAFVNPADAARLGVSTGDIVRLRSRVGEIEAPVKVDEDMSPGVVSIPHGWGHLDDQALLTVAHSQGSANVNILSDDGPAAIDRPSGGASFNGVPVDIEFVRKVAQVG